MTTTRVKSQRQLTKVAVLLDSGAFSAWIRQEGSIDLDAYIDYVKANRPIVDLYVNLDVLPGTYGTPVTATDITTSATQSYANLQIMKDAGLSPIPVFHQGEPFFWLERMLADGEDYIGFSPRQDLAASYQQRWLDEVFTVLTDKNGNPLIDTHGFGVTKIDFLLRYPFTTVDSTRWTIDAGYGHVLLPHWEIDRFDYLQPPYIIATTGVDSVPNAKKQIDGFGEETRRHIIDYLASLGLTVEQLRTDRLGRIRTYLHYFDEMVKQLQPFQFRTPYSGFDNFPVELSFGLVPIVRRKLRVFFATFCRGCDVEVVDRMGIRDRLLSYYELRNQQESALYDYVRNGFLPPKREIPKRGRGRAKSNEPVRSPWEG